MTVRAGQKLPRSDTPSGIGRMPLPASVKSTSDVIDCARSPEVAPTEATKRSRKILSTTTTDGQACGDLERAAETCWLSGKWENLLSGI